MAERIKDKQSARRATQMLQGVALLLCAGGVSMAMFGLPGDDFSKQSDVSFTPTVPGEDLAPTPEVAQPEPDAPAYSPEDIDYNFQYLSNYPVVLETPIDDDPVEDEPSLDGSGIEVRYVGAITSRGQMAACLNIAGVSKIMRPGEVYETVELIEVANDSVVLSVNGSEAEELEKSERTGSGVLVATGGAPAANPVDANARQANAPREITEDMSREERRAVLMERARSERDRWQRERGRDGGPPN